MATVLRTYTGTDRADLVALWEACGLTRPWNDPNRDIDRKVADGPEGLLVLVDEGALVGSVMVGYDGHRGWVNYLAVSPDRQGSGYGRRLMEACEAWLAERGGAKLNLQVREGNTEALAFYAALGYERDAAISLGKRLVRDD